jgi:hypothetical protein
VIIVQLLSETLTAHYGTVTETWTRKFPNFDRAIGRVTQWFNGSNAHAIGAVLIANAIIMALVDPAFGINVLSLRLLISTVLTIGLISAGSNLAAAWIARRYWGTESSLNATGLALVVALAGMALSRLLHFMPGLLEGNAFDLDAEEDEKLRDAVRLEVICGWVLLGMAAVGWITATLWTPSQNAGQLLVHDVINGVCVGGLGNLFIALLPLPALRGGLLIRHSRTQWIAQSLITAAAFALIVAPQTSNWLHVNNLVRWLTITVCFVCLASGAIVVLNHRLHRAHRKSATPDAAGLLEPEPAG